MSLQQAQFGDWYITHLTHSHPSGVNGLLATFVDWAFLQSARRRDRMGEPLVRAHVRTKGFQQPVEGAELPSPQKALSFGIEWCQPARRRRWVAGFLRKLIMCGHK